MSGGGPGASGAGARRLVRCAGVKSGKTLPVLDLTTASGYRSALSLLESNLGWVLFPGPKLAMALFSWLTSESQVSPAKQAEAAERILEAGRRHGAKRIRMTVARDVGARLKTTVKGAHVEAGVGEAGTMELEVEYE